MLYTSGAINLGKVDAGNTTTDFDLMKLNARVTIGTALAPEWKGVKVNLLDTPGF